MKQVAITYMFLFLYTSILLAQQHDNVWFVGNGAYNSSSARLDFNASTILTDTFARNLPMWRSSVSMSDSLGNLLFYSNSIQIFNSNYQLMQNGDSLNPGQSANDNRDYGYMVPEGSIIIPHPKQANKYYLFHQSYSTAAANNNFAEYLYYTLIDMNANSGLGRVEKKNQLLVTDSLCLGQLEAVKHGNGKDWWLLQSISGTNGFYTFLITGDTIILKPKQYVGNNNRFAGWEGTGQAVFSPDGTVYARYDYKNDLDIFDFDRCTGMLSNPLHIPIQDSLDMIGLSLVGGGTAISPNNRFLYVSSYVDLYQFDLWSPNIASSMITVAHYDYFSDILRTIFGFIQLAPNGKIYGYAEGTRYLHIIDNPDSAGTSCNVQQHGLFIHHYNGHFIPNFPHYRTLPLAGSLCDTLTGVEQAVSTNSNSSQLRLYPNPASTSISIESSQPISRMMVYNALGQQVLFVSGREQKLLELETRSLENGAYYVTVWLEGKVVTKQLQILR